MRLESPQSFDEYFAQAQESTSGFLASGATSVDLLRRLHGFMFQHVLADVEVAPTCGILGLNAVMVWLSAIRAALTGHSASAFPLFRASMETACYAYVIHLDPELERTWLERHKSNSARARCRKAFSSVVRDTANSVQSRDTAWNGVREWISEAYEAAIDFGAHPNPKSVLPSLRIDDQRSDGFVGLNVGGVYGASSFETRHLAVACLDYGQIIALILLNLSPEVSSDAAEVFNTINDEKEAYLREAFDDVR